MDRSLFPALALALAAMLSTAEAQTVTGKAPTTPSVVVDTRDAPSLGPDNAPVTIVEFGDFQCPFCAQGAKALRRLHTIYPDRVRWVFKHYPLRTVHPEAALAHEAAIAAQEQGKFWEMHELIFRNQTQVSYKDLVGYAEQIGLNMASFRDALDTRRLRPRVIRDLDEARRLRVIATPTYFINGTRYLGARTTSDFRLLVDALVRRPVAAPEIPDAPAAGSTTR